MAQDINLTSQKWLSLIFEGKNHEYGAYVLRNESSDRHLKALLIITIVGLGLVYLPNLIKSVIPEKKDNIIQTEEVVMADLTQEIPEEDLIKQMEVVPPPPLLKETIQFTPPVIAKDEEVAEDQLMKNQDDLTDSKADISIKDVEGVKDGGVDIADLAQNQVIIQEEKAPEIYVHVEEMPLFPGGEAAMMKWLRDEIKYPTIAQEQGIQGRVSLRFVVKPDGTVDDIQVVKSLEPSCDKEAVRAVKKMPKWTPGRQNGKPVFVYFNLPVTFKFAQ
jgi:protein TonB